MHRGKDRDRLLGDVDACFLRFCEKKEKEKEKEKGKRKESENLLSSLSLDL